MNESEDKINPDHYTYSKYQAIDIIEDLSSELDGFDGFCIGNVPKLNPILVA